MNVEQDWNNFIVYVLVNVGYHVQNLKDMSQSASIAMLQ